MRPAIEPVQGRECVYNHPVGSRCPACADWPYAKGGAAAWNDRLALVAAIVAELRDITTRFGLAGQVDTETVAWAANHIEAKFGGGKHGDR